ncbi:hypothetical protein F4604DRAFT_1725211 [Suillus subluteus]|nr:hypothetical protein F4604DRAFT_1725211 [Suillus subluteus]
MTMANWLLSLLMELVCFTVVTSSSKLQSFIRDCNNNHKLSRTWLQDSLFSQHRFLIPFAVDPLQVAVSLPGPHVTVTDGQQNRHLFLIEFLLASFPDLASASRRCECAFTRNEPRWAWPWVRVKENPKICGDRIFVYYCMEEDDGPVPDTMFDWRNPAYAKSLSPLCSCKYPAAHHKQHPLLQLVVRLFLARGFRLFLERE